MVQFNINRKGENKMIVATILLFGFLAVFGGCSVEGFAENLPLEMTGFLYFTFGAGVTTLVLWFGRWADDVIE